MTAMSVQDATSSSDCVFPSCPFEAEPGRDRCRQHLNRTSGGSTMTATATTAVWCKRDGCDQPAEDSTGPYARLCTEHKSEAVSRGGTSPLADLAKKIVPLAKQLDKARAKLAETPSTQGAKVAFDEATRRASATPSPENLARVVEATKQLQQGAPKRIRLENDVAQAERALGLAVQAFVREARAA